MYICLVIEKWDTNSPQHWSKPATQQPKMLSTARSNQNKQRQWTCDFTGYATEKLSNSFASIGDQASSTLLTTSPNTIRKKKEPCNPNTSQQKRHLMTSERETPHTKPTWLPRKYIHDYLRIRIKEQLSYSTLLHTFFLLLKWIHRRLAYSVDTLRASPMPWIFLFKKQNMSCSSVFAKSMTMSTWMQTGTHCLFQQMAVLQQYHNSVFLFWFRCPECVLKRRSILLNLS